METDASEFSKSNGASSRAEFAGISNMLPTKISSVSATPNEFVFIFSSKHLQQNGLFPAHDSYIAYTMTQESKLSYSSASEKEA